MEQNPMRKLAIGAIASLVVILLLLLFVVRFKHIDAHETGVYVGWSGLDPKPVYTGMAVYCPFKTSLYVANTGQQRFVMNNESSKVEKHALGREKDDFKIVSTDNQDMTVSVQVMWHRDPAKVPLQQSRGPVDKDELFVETVLRQPTQNAVKSVLTNMKAIEAYSGPEHMKAQLEIEKILRTHPELVELGVIIDSFLIEVKLDPEYTAPIKQRQVAIQEQLAYVEKIKAAEKKAEQAKADAQADFNTQVVAAERDKQVAVTKAQQLSESAILQAEGEKQKVILEGEAKKAAAENEAAAILAKGTAEAAAAKLLYASYDSVGGQTFARIKVAEQMAAAYSGVRGFIPEKMTISTFADSFQKGIGIVVDPAK